LVADGRLVPLARIVHLEPDQEPDRRRHCHVRRVPDVVGHQLDRQLRRPDDADGADALVADRSLRRFRERRHRHQARDLLPEFHGLRPLPHRQVGGQRKVARLVMQKILGIIGWIGTILVFGALLIRGVPFLGIPSVYPAGDQYATYAAWAGLVCVLLYMAGQWRDVATFYQGRGARYGTMSIVSIIVFLAILAAVNYLSTRQNKRWDFTANQVYSLSDQTVKLLQSLKDPVKFTVYDQQVNFDRFKERLNEFTYHSKNVTVDYVDADREPTKTKA